MSKAGSDTMFEWIKRLFKRDTFWEDQRKAMEERHAREIIAIEKSAGILFTDDSTIYGIRYGDLQKTKEG